MNEKRPCAITRAGPFCFKFCRLCHLIRPGTGDLAGDFGGFCFKTGRLPGLCILRLPALIRSKRA